MERIIFQHKRAMAAMTDPRTDAIAVSQNAKHICSEMLQISSAATVEALHICAVANSMAQVWATVSTALAKYQHERQQRRKDVEDCMTQLLRRLPPLLPQLTANHASNVLMSLSKINMPVTGHLQGLTVKLTQKVATGDANAREIARALSALAQWDAQVWHDPTHAAAMRAIIWHFGTTLNHSGGQQAPTSMDIAHILLSAVKLKLRPTDEVLDAASAYMVALIQRPTTYAVEARSIAGVLQSLDQLRYAPTTQQASRLLKQFVMLCNTSPPQQPGLRDIGTVIAAAAGLGFTELGYVMWGIGFQVIHTEGVSSQVLCSVCKSMAILNVLDLDTLEVVLNSLHAQGSSAVSDKSLLQLYQALYRLQPFPHDSKAMHSAWGGAYQRVKALGNKDCLLARHRGVAPLNQALASLQLRHRTSVQFSPYTADAVLHQKVPGGGPILVVVVHASDLLNNNPDRYVFRELRPSVVECKLHARCHLVPGSGCTARMQMP